jgi:hypothetical protein
MFYKLNINKKNLSLSLETLQKEHNRVLLLAKTRTKTFKDQYNNYYWSRLQDLNLLIQLKSREDKK